MSSPRRLFPEDATDPSGELQKLAEENAQLKQQLVAARAGQEAARPDAQDLGQFIAEIAHEMRNPLASILAVLEAWEHEPEEGFDTFGLRLQRESRRLADLMNDVLEFARPSHRPSHAVHLHSLVDEVIGSSDLAARGANVEVVAQLPAEAPALEGDYVGLQRALSNVVENAIQHSPARSQVAISAEVRGDSVVLSVKDRGPGIAAAALERIFEPFFTRRRGGSGLGLAIARKVVYEHGGQIEAGNRSDGGARISMTLPLPTATGGPRALPPPDAP